MNKKFVYEVGNNKKVINRGQQMISKFNNQTSLLNGQYSTTETMTTHSAEEGSAHNNIKCDFKKRQPYLN
jgi:hypothetical protein